MHDLFTEIWSSVRRNKLRTILTGLAVSWGIFIIILLLGAGNGLMNAFMKQSHDFATNTMELYGGMTTKPYDGLQQGRWVPLTDQDVKVLQGPLFSDHIDKVSASVSADGVNKLIDGTRTYTVTLYGVYPANKEMNGVKILAGRYINENDLNERRKVAVISDVQAEDLMAGRDNYKAILGRAITVDDQVFTVVGVRRSDRQWRDTRIHVPFSTYKLIFAYDNLVDKITFTFHGLRTQKENEAFEKRVRTVLNRAHRAAPDDEGALYVWNRFTQNMQMNRGTDILTKALWVVGIFTLLGGIVGVSNIMLITVKERTHEFGIRKAIGAKPKDITKLILAESVAITALFGLFGMLLGLGACEVMNATIGSTSMDIFGESVKLLDNPRVGWGVAIEATIVLIVAGTIAGLSPAMKAAKVRPIEALREGKG